MDVQKFYKNRPVVVQQPKTTLDPREGIGGGEIPSRVGKEGLRTEGVSKPPQPRGLVGSTIAEHVPSIRATMKGESSLKLIFSGNAKIHSKKRYPENAGWPATNRRKSYHTRNTVQLLVIKIKRVIRLNDKMLQALALKRVGGFQEACLLKASFGALGTTVGPSDNI